MEVLFKDKLITEAEDNNQPFVIATDLELHKTYKVSFTLDNDCTLLVYEKGEHLRKNTFNTNGFAYLTNVRYNFVGKMLTNNELYMMVNKAYKDEVLTITNLEITEV